MKRCSLYGLVLDCDSIFQVHKVVLNQRITSTFTLKPLSSNAKSWCWVGMNLPEEASEPVLEELAVRFKTEETAKIFEHVVLQCIERLGSSEQGMCIHF